MFQVAIDKRHFIAMERDVARVDRVAAVVEDGCFPSVRRGKEAVHAVVPEQLEKSLHHDIQIAE